ncbi:pseudouridylate synthase TRUB2, mitochondrial isoform 1-T2 [Discoglossus pictus]
MSRFAPAVYRTLHGVFAVYKPPGVHWKSVRDTVETNLLKDLNSLKQPPPQHQIRFLPAGTEGNDGVELTRVPTSVPVLADHVLVKGPAYTHLKVGAGHRLDVQSSGVFLLALGHGNKLLTDMYHSHCTRDYTVRATFGKATDDFTDSGKVIEKTTYDHITRDKLERVLAVIQGSNQKALLMHSHIDLKTQEAYELAVEGQLRPMDKSPPIILGARCLEFSPPDFTLEIQCMHETQQYLRKLIHEIGLELRCSATCSQVRRTRDGTFTADCSLTHKHWDLTNIRRAIKECQERAVEMIRGKTPESEEMTESEGSNTMASTSEEDVLRV